MKLKLNVNAKLTHQLLPTLDGELAWILSTRNAAKHFGECLLRNDRRIPLKVDEQRLADYKRASIVGSLLVFSRPKQISTFVTKLFNCPVLLVTLIQRHWTVPFNQTIVRERQSTLAIPRRTAVMRRLNLEHSQHRSESVVWLRQSPLTFAHYIRDDVTNAKSWCKLSTTAQACDRWIRMLQVRFATNRAIDKWRNIMFNTGQPTALRCNERGVRI